MWDAIREQEKVSVRSQEDICKLETHIEHILRSFKDQILEKDSEWCRFREVLDMETDI